MKKLLLILLFFVSLAAAKAQDKIITIKQDTIECRIVSVNAERISYEQKTAGKHFVGKSISTSEVLKYSRTGKPGSMDGSLGHEKTKRERPEHRWLFSLQGGLAHSLTDYDNFKNSLLSSGNSASVTNDYISKLKNGVHINSSLHYLLTTFFGLGVDYNLFHSASKGEFMSQAYRQMNLPIYSNSRLDIRLYTQFAGASVLFQQFPDKKRRIKITETLTPGIIMFRDESRYYTLWVNTGYGYGSYNTPLYSFPLNSVSTSTTFGAKGSLSIEYGITPQLSAGLAGNFMWAELHKESTKGSYYDTKDQKLAKPLNISHIDYGFTVRYSF